MVDVPPAIPVTVPVAEPMVAAAVLLLLHVPEAVASLRVNVRPAHTGVLFVIAAGSGSTVTVVTAVQLLLIV